MQNVIKSKKVKWIAVPEDLTLDKKISDGAFRCYTILVRKAFWTENRTKMLNEEIAALTGKHVRSVRRHITELVEAGYIERKIFTMHQKHNDRYHTVRSIKIPNTINVA